MERDYTAMRAQAGLLRRDYSCEEVKFWQHTDGKGLHGYEGTSGLLRRDYSCEEVKFWQHTDGKGLHGYEGTSGLLRRDYSCEEVKFWQHTREVNFGRTLIIRTDTL